MPPASAALAASSRLAAYAAELRLPPPPLPCLEPDVDDVDAAQQKEAREASHLSDGAVRVAVLRPGDPYDGKNKPSEERGDLVVFHLDVREPPEDAASHGGLEQRVLFSTRGTGGDDSGAPFVAVLGPRGAPHRLPRAWELAVADSTPGTRIAVRCRGALFGWAGETCGVSVPSASLDPAGDYLYDVQLLRFYPADEVAAVPLRPFVGGGVDLADDDDDGGTAAADGGKKDAHLADASGNPAALKLTLEQGNTWESPRAPFEVTFSVKASAPSPDDGRLGDGEAFYEAGKTAKGKEAAASPLVTATMGDGSLPAALEAALSSVCQGETAVVSLPLAAFKSSSEKKNKKPLLFSLPDSLPRSVVSSGRLELTVRVDSMVQVRDLVGPAPGKADSSTSAGRQPRGRVTKKRVREGRGEFPADCPLGDCAVRVHVRAVELLSKVSEGGGGEEEVEGVVLWDTRKGPTTSTTVRGSTSPSSSSSPSTAPPPFEFVIGTGRAPDAVDLAVCLMTPGELSVVDSDWDHARFGSGVWSGGDETGDVPSGLVDGASASVASEGTESEGRRVRFHVELVDFDAPDRDPTPDARLARSEELRSQGNAVLRSRVPRALELASGKYRRAAHLLQSALDFDTEEQHAAAAKGRAAANANLAAVALKQDKWGEALEACSRALDDDPRHAKALFRRATALASLGRFDEADEAFKLAEGAAGDERSKADVARERARWVARRKRAGEKQRTEMAGFLKN